MKEVIAVVVGILLGASAYYIYISTQKKDLESFSDDISCLQICSMSYPEAVGCIGKRSANNPLPKICETLLDCVNDCRDGQLQNMVNATKTWRGPYGTLL